MKKNSLVFSVAFSTALSLSLGSSAIYAKDNGKANPSPSASAQSNGNGNSNSNNGNSGGNSSNAAGTNSANTNSSNGNSSNSNAGGNSATKSNSSNNSDSSKAENPKNPVAKESSNVKLKAAGVPADKVNSRAVKASVVRSRTSTDCQSVTAAAKKRLAEDPCSDFIVVFQPGLARGNSDELLKSSGAQVKRQFSSIFNGALVTGPLSKMQALANNPNVLVVEDDLEVKSTAIQSSAPWGLDRIDQLSLPLSGTFNDGDQMGLNSYSFVVDTGIDATNVDFGGRVTSGFTAVADGRGSSDCNGHGTHVAGIIGGNQYGVAKKTTLIPVRVLDCTGSGSYSSVISGLDWIAANYRAGDAAVVNMSLGGPASSTLDGAVRNLISKGITVVVAAGNSNADACNYSPSGVLDAITVGATESNDYRASYSNFGSCLDVFAPGSAITSTWIGANSTNTISGTSMASPSVAGVVARFLSNNPSLTPAQVSNSIKASATKNVVINPGVNSLNQLVFLDVTPDTTTVTPFDSTPTFKKVIPRGKKR